MTTVPRAALDEVVAHAEQAVVAWPDELREGAPWHKGRLADRSPALTSPLWRLVRTLRCGGHFTPLPSMSMSVTDSPHAPSRLVGLHVLEVGSQALEVLASWAGLAQLRSLRIQAWQGYQPGWAARLLHGLDPAQVRELHFVHQGEALEEVIAALTGHDWPHLEALAPPECRDEHVEAICNATFARSLRSLVVDPRGLGDEGARRLLADLGSGTVESLELVREPRPISVALAETIGGAYPNLASLRGRLARGALAGFCAHAETRALSTLHVCYESGTDAADCETLAAWSGAEALRNLEMGAGAKIDDDALAALGRSVHLTGLESVTFEQCTFGEAGARAWADGGAQPRELVIDRVRELGDAAAQAIIASAGSARLVRLALPETGIGDATARALAEAAPRMPALVEIDLSYGNVSIDGLRAILGSELAARLEGLHLCTPIDASRRLGPAGFELIASASLPRLRRLSLAAQEIDFYAWLDRLESLSAPRGARCAGQPQLPGCGVRPLRDRAPRPSPPARAALRRGALSADPERRADAGKGSAGVERRASSAQRSPPRRCPRLGRRGCRRQ